MQRLSFYLLRQIAYAFLFAGTAVVFVVLFTQSFRLLSFVINNSGTLLIFLQLMGLMIPTFLPLVVPLSLGVAVIFTYHKLAMDSELAVMRAVGVSSIRLARPVLILAVLIAICSYGLTLFVTPWANRELVALEYKVRDSFSVFLVRAGTFNDLMPGLTFYVRDRGKNGELEGILIHDVRSPEKPVTIMAETGQFTASESADPEIVVFKGKRQEINRETGRLSQLDFDRYVIDLGLVHNNGSDRIPDAREQPSSILFSTVINNNTKSKAVNDKASMEKLQAEMHQRLTSPLLAIGYSLIGVTAILVGAFNRRGMTNRLVIAAVAIIFMQAASLSIGNLIAKYSGLSPAIYVLELLPLPICFVLLRSNRLPHIQLPQMPWLERLISRKSS